MPTSSPIDPRVRVGHLHLKVADLERALHFYRDILGLEVTQKLGKTPLSCPQEVITTTSR